MAPIALAVVSEACIYTHTGFPVVHVELYIVVNYSHIVMNSACGQSFATAVGHTELEVARFPVQREVELVLLYTQYVCCSGPWTDITVMYHAVPDSCMWCLLVSIQVRSYRPGSRNKESLFAGCTACN